MRALTAVVIVLLVLVTLVIVNHARATPPAQDCFDELLVNWNRFASDANNHIHTNDAKRTNHEKAHDRMDREYEALHSLACW